METKWQFCLWLPSRQYNSTDHLLPTWLWVNNRVTPNWIPTKWKHRLNLKPAVPWWLNFHPYPPVPFHTRRCWFPPSAAMAPRSSIAPPCPRPHEVDLWGKSEHVSNFWLVLNPCHFGPVLILDKHPCSIFGGSPVSNHPNVSREIKKKPLPLQGAGSYFEKHPCSICGVPCFNAHPNGPVGFAPNQTLSDVHSGPCLVNPIRVGRALHQFPDT